MSKTSKPKDIKMIVTMRSLVQNSAPGFAACYTLYMAIPIRVTEESVKSMKDGGTFGRTFVVERALAKAMSAIGAPPVATATVGQYHFCRAIDGIMELMCANDFVKLHEQGSTTPGASPPHSFWIPQKDFTRLFGAKYPKIAI